MQYASVTQINPIVITENGQVKGENRNGIAVFRGIPYGGPCDGERRFLPPVPAESWEGVRDCTNNGPIAVQEMGSIQGWDDQGPAFHGGRKEIFKLETEVMSENCLVLNVLTPGLDQQKRPVLFYIHGGGYANCSGTLGLGADRLCDEENIVVVSVNHRLGPFGYTYLGDLDPKYAQSGIAGILDLVLALQWVQKNIRNFGGDPDCVTIVGESGGGSKVSVLLSMDITEGLFHRAIVESGSLPAFRKTHEEGTAMARKALAHLKVDPENLQKLAKVSAEEIQSLVYLMDKEHKAFDPVYDGEIVPAGCCETFHLAPWARDVSIIIGASEEELTVFQGKECFEMDRDSFIVGMLEETVHPPVIRTPRSLCTRENLDRLFALLEETSKPGDDYAHKYEKILSHVTFSWNSVIQAEDYLTQGCRNLWQYFVTYDSHHPVYPEYRFAWHCATLPLQMRVVLHPEDEKLSREIAHITGVFAKNGTPETDHFRWPRFTAENKETLVVDEVSVVKNNPQGRLHEILFGEG